MNEIALNQNGERITLHGETFEVLIRRFKNPGKPGGPEKVVDRNGLPLYVKPSIPMNDFLAAVRHVSGRYRGDQVDGHRKTIAGAETLYIDVSDPERGGNEESDARDHVVIELGRSQADAMKTLAACLSEMVSSAAHLVRAADGAGLPAREPVQPIVQAPVAPEPAVVEPAPEYGLAHVLADALGKRSHCSTTCSSPRSAASARSRRWPSSAGRR